MTKTNVNVFLIFDELLFACINVLNFCLGKPFFPNYWSLRRENFTAGGAKPQRKLKENTNQNYANFASAREVLGLGGKIFNTDRCSASGH